eukprot:jgi/Chlat1/8720/Chrsp9S08550
MPGILSVRVLSASDLRLHDGPIKNDTFIRVHLSGQEKRTAVAKQTASPVFNEDFTFPLASLSDKLSVAVFSSGRFSEELVGSVEISMPSIIELGYRDEVFLLTDAKTAAAGKVHLQLTFTLSDEERQKLEELAGSAVAEAVARDTMVALLTFTVCEARVTGGRTLNMPKGELFVSVTMGGQETNSDFPSMVNSDKGKTCQFPVGSADTSISFACYDATLERQQIGTATVSIPILAAQPTQDQWIPLLQGGKRVGDVHLVLKYAGIPKISGNGRLVQPLSQQHQPVDEPVKKRAGPGKGLGIIGAILAFTGAYLLWPKPEFYTVKRGDYLEKLTEDCNDPSSKFYSLNPDICNRDLIFPGQKIRLK